VEYKVQIPRKVIVTADVKRHALVLMLFEGQADRREGFALDPKSAKATAARLVETADALIAHTESKGQPIQ
jgi:hypothetical protein